MDYLIKVWIQTSAGVAWEMEKASLQSENDSLAHKIKELEEQVCPNCLHQSFSSFTASEGKRIGFRVSEMGLNG